MRIFLFAFIMLACCAQRTFSQQRQRTYCNPMNLDYGYTPIPNFSTWGRHRATADPVITMYKGDYYLFSTNQWGYWWSPDLYHWTFVSKSFLKPYHHVYDDLCAPAVVVLGDTLLVFGSTYTSDFPIWMSTDPKHNQWKEAVDSFRIGGWDPDFFADDDGKLYMYNGSSNLYPIYGVEINRTTLAPIGERKPLLQLHDSLYGWQRFGEYHDNTFLDPFMEGAWMTKHDGKYYLQYGAPATEFSGYADGVAVSNSPLGPFVNQDHNPFSSKMGGFARGSGHGATFQDRWNNWWHVSTMIVNVKNNFERRIGLWPAGFDKNGVLYTDTDFGDYPHFLPNGPANHLESQFTGWMLLNYNKPVTVSSTYGSYNANNAVDESIKSYWCAASGNKGEWIQSDLGQSSTVNAIQINYADQDVHFLGKQQNTYHQYILYASEDGSHWQVITDKSRNLTDVPHDYVELEHPLRARYIKLVNVRVPDGKFAVSGLRVFGIANGPKPSAVQDFMVLRGEKDKRSAWLRWQPVNNAYAYNIYIGTAPDKLYTSIMVYGNANNEYWLKTLDRNLTYYITIEAINENGISERYPIIESK